MKHECVLILDFGGQYKQLIARRVREQHVYCIVKPSDTPLEEIKAGGYKAIIFTGGPSSVNAADSPKVDPGIFSLGVPVLGICYGAQLMTYSLGGQVVSPDHREYGKAELRLAETENALFKGIETETSCWMSHTDLIARVPEGFSVLASSPSCPVAAMGDPSRLLYAVQFHPEVEHTPFGRALLRNFLYEVAGCAGDWRMDDYVTTTVEAIRRQVGDREVICALSGGVDSAVAARLVHEAIGNQLTCVFVDHGLLRKNEGDEVEAIFRDGFSMNLIRVNAEDLFLDKLAGISDPESKRKIIGETFIRVFEAEKKKLSSASFLVQGTIYPDVIESGGGKTAVIKSHHNVGGLPEDVDFELIEPLRDLFKDEVREVGLRVGLPESLVWRQPFPGPGLAVRVLGEITREKLEILRDADFVFRDEIEKAGLSRSLNQYFAVLPDIRSVGVMGDERTYDYTIALRAVTTQDFMTADWARIPLDVLDVISRRLVNEVKHVNRVVYDITSKPPATIEWE